MNRRILISDLLAGLSVSFAALALGAAFGVMSGRGAFAGMIAAGVIPIMTGLFGGTKLGISGPTGPMTAVSSVTIAFAYDHFPDRALAEQFITLVFLMTGVLLVLCGILRVGKYINKVPQVVILGFMSGIALLIWVDQIKVLFGLDGKQAPSGSLVTTILVAASTFLLILFFPRLLKIFKVPRNVTTFIPSTLTGIILMTIITTLLLPGLGRIDLGVSIESLSDFGHHVAGYFPSAAILTPDYLWMALPYALELMMLGYLDSLLTALIMDHLTHETSKKDQELIGQGLSNAAAAIAQGLPGAQATIRSVLLFKEGGKTRVGVVVAGLFVLLGFIAFKDYVTLITSAVFIGVLFKAGLDVFEKDFVKAYLSRKWYSNRRRNLQAGFIVYTMLITALVDLNVAVISGTLIFYIARAKFGFTDIEVDFASEAQGLTLAPVEVKKSENGHPRPVTIVDQVDPMTYYQKLLANNKEWVKSKTDADPEFFSRLASGQNPPVLWIGCSDSRVPANEITGTQPGEIFVHRNIANMVVHTDMNMLSVLDYAVNVLHVKHVIVCGHYGCGGVRAAMGHQQFGLIDNWLRHIKDVYRVHQDELEEIVSLQQRENRFVELNVLEQVFDLSKTSIIQNSWTTRNSPILHGWVYDIRNGIVKDLDVTIRNNADVPRVYRFDATAEQVISGR